jgi:hypothetical protein
MRTLVSLADWFGAFTCLSVCIAILGTTWMQTRKAAAMAPWAIVRAWIVMGFGSACLLWAAGRVAAAALGFR